MKSSYLRSAKRLPSDAAIALIVLYKKLISPVLPPSCRFYPSCSSYSMEALRKHGLFKGTLLSLWRVIRCNPFTKGGFDPVK